jgi:amino acid transporter
MADGLVWAELGAALPFDGGGYRFLLESYGPERWGRLVSFLFLWCAVVMGPLYWASGALGFSQYATYLFPAMTPIGAKLLAIAICLFSTWLIYRRIDGIGRMGVAFGLVILFAGAWIILEGILHAHPAQLIPARGAFVPSREFFSGLGAATLFAAYDYAGYNAVCNVAGEVTEPRKTIPRSIIAAIVVVGLLYISMNVSIVAGMPWQQATHSSFVVSDFIANVQGPRAAVAMTVLVLASTLAGVFAGMLGTSRVPYAAAVGGRFFRVFGRLDPAGEFPSFSVVFVGLSSAACCVFSLETVIKASVVATTILSSLTAVAAPTLLRRIRPDVKLPFRMPLYPLPSLVALAGWGYIIATSGWQYILISLGLLAIGVGAYLWRARRAGEWPYRSTARLQG